MQGLLKIGGAVTAKAFACSLYVRYKTKSKAKTRPDQAR
jgi:hypothetical protein